MAPRSNAPHPVAPATGRDDAAKRAVYLVATFSSLVPVLVLLAMVYTALGALGQLDRPAATIGATLLVLLITIPVSMVIGISKNTAPIDLAVDCLRRMARGDLSGRMPEVGVGSYRELALAVNRSADALSTMVQAVGTAVTTLTAASQELTAASGRTAGSVHRASSEATQAAGVARDVSGDVQRVAEGSEELSASIQEITQNASQAAQIADEAVRVADETSQIVGRLGDSSTEIGNVVQVITAIAEQTNLLALNATIESARAGDAGKGFAVVAEEVKQLAQETSRATDDISRRIETIQNETSGAVSAIEQITSVIGKIRDYQTAIAGAVEEQTATTAEVARSISAAAEGSSEIASSLGAVAAAAEESGAVADDTGRAVRDVERVTTELRRALGGFSEVAGATSGR